MLYKVNIFLRFSPSSLPLTKYIVCVWYEYFNFPNAEYYSIKPFYIKVVWNYISNKYNSS